MIELITMLPLLGAPNIEKSPIYEYQIQTSAENAQVLQVEPELTVEEKIASNYYKCDTDTQWIRKDTAECKQKTSNTPPKAQSPVRTAGNSSQASSGWYPKYQCTWYVSTRRAVGQWNNASDWAWQAERDGYTVSTTPISGSIAWKYGHVAFVESVSGDTMVVSEANYDSRGSIRTIEVPVSSYSKFIY